MVTIVGAVGATSNEPALLHALLPTSRVNSRLALPQQAQDGEVRERLPAGIDLRKKLQAADHCRLSFFAHSTRITSVFHRFPVDSEAPSVDTRQT
jgi:hypothetical protein